MSKAALFLVAAATVLLALPASAAEYNCAEKATGTKLNDLDITISKREAAITEMKEEVTAGGGSTEQQKKALGSFEEKLAKAKADREALLKECNAKSAP